MSSQHNNVSTIKQVTSLLNCSTCFAAAAAVITFAIIQPTIQREPTNQFPILTQKDPIKFSLSLSPIFKDGKKVKLKGEEKGKN